MSKKFITRAELSKITRYAQTTIASHKEQFPEFIKTGSKFNSRVLYSVEDVKQWLKDNGMEKLIPVLEEMVNE